MKERELREIAECVYCEKPFGHTQLPSFWRVTLEHFILDMPALQRQSGLAMFMGNAVLAEVMGPNETLARRLVEHKATVCANCFDEHLQPLLDKMTAPEMEPDE